MPKLSTAHYQKLAAFRYEIRKFLAFSEQAARSSGIEPQQHQFLLALRGLPEGARPTIGTVAERLRVQHHTAVALVDKLESRKLIARERGLDDRREVLLRLMPEGERILRQLSELHQQQLLGVGPALVATLGSLLGSQTGAMSKPLRVKRVPLHPGDPSKCVQSHQTPTVRKPSGTVSRT